MMWPDLEYESLPDAVMVRVTAVVEADPPAGLTVSHDASDVAVQESSAMIETVVVPPALSTDTAEEEREGGRTLGFIGNNNVIR